MNFKSELPLTLETIGKFEIFSSLVKPGNCVKWSGMLQFSSCTH